MASESAFNIGEAPSTIIADSSGAWNPRTRRADIDQIKLRVREVPITDIALFDDLVGCREQRQRHGKAKGPRSLRVDDELEFVRLYDRQFRRLGPP